MLKRFKVYVTCTIMGTMNIDAHDANDAQCKAEDMDGDDVLSDMSKSDYDVCADDAEEIDYEGED